MIVRKRLDRPPERGSRKKEALKYANTERFNLPWHVNNPKSNAFCALFGVVAVSAKLAKRPQR